MSQLNQQIWSEIILDVLYAGYNEMQGIFTDDSASLVKSGARFRKIHIANAGDIGDLTINDNTLKLDPTRRTDVAVEYSLNKFEIGPKVVEREAVLSTAYDNIKSVVESLAGAVKEGMAYTLRKNWYVDDFEIETSGSGTTATFGNGLRKALTHADLMLAKRKLDAQKMPLTDRYAVLSATMANDLLDDLFTKGYNVRFIEKDALSILDEKIAGFTIIQVPVCLFGEVSGATIETLDYNEDPTDADNLVEISLCFHKNYVSGGMDTPHIFYNENDARFRGDVITIQSYSGGAPRSNDGLGIIPVVGAIE